MVSLNEILFLRDGKMVFGELVFFDKDERVVDVSSEKGDSSIACMKMVANVQDTCLPNGRACICLKENCLYVKKLFANGRNAVGVYALFVEEEYCCFDSLGAWYACLQLYYVSAVCTM